MTDHNPIQSLIDNEALDNILVGQKDKILLMILELGESTTMQEAILRASRVQGAIEVTMSLWAITDYSYKTGEIDQRLNTTLASVLERFGCEDPSQILKP